MKCCVAFFYVLLFSSTSFGQKAFESQSESTTYFSFHINYWINLHHFLYQKAKGSQLKKLQEDGINFQDIGEATVYRNLDTSQKQKIEAAIIFYKKNIIQKDLLRDLGKIRAWLQTQKSKSISDTLFTAKVTTMLNNASEVYHDTFWPIHKAQNTKILKKQIGLIKAMESPIIPKMEKLSLNKWPENEKVRVDLTVYANYAGAYTPSRPKMNILISTISPWSLEIGFIETIFHEGSHLLFNYGGPWRGGISEVFEKNDYQMKYPIHLWHVSLFFLCGKICKEEFSKRGIKDYVMVMDKRNIFEKYRSKQTFLILDKYYKSDLTFSETIKDLLEHLKATTNDF